MLIILDQFEEYFLYHAGGRRRRHVRGRVPARRQPARPARELPRLDARGLDRQARLLQGPDPEPLRQLPAHRSSRARARRATRSSSPSSSSTGGCRAGTPPMKIEPALVGPGAGPGDDRPRGIAGRGKGRFGTASAARTAKSASRRRTCSSS